MLAMEESQDTLTAHVLAVDDDPSVRKVICNYLGDNDIRVTALASGRDIADVMAREVIDLLVLDWRLPGEDGLELIRKVRALEAERGGRIPALALTAYSGRTNRETAQAAGFDQQVSKPVVPAELVAQAALLAGTRARP